MSAGREGSRVRGREKKGGEDCCSETKEETLAVECVRIAYTNNDEWPCGQTSRVVTQFLLNFIGVISLDNALLVFLDIIVKGNVKGTSMDPHLQHFSFHSVYLLDSILAHGINSHLHCCSLHFLRHIRRFHHALGRFFLSGSR